MVSTFIIVFTLPVLTEAILFRMYRFFIGSYCQCNFILLCTNFNISVVSTIFWYVQLSSQYSGRSSCLLNIMEGLVVSLIFWLVQLSPQYSGRSSCLLNILVGLVVSSIFLQVQLSPSQYPGRPSCLLLNILVGLEFSYSIYIIGCLFVTLPCYPALNCIIFPIPLHCKVQTAENTRRQTYPRKV